MDVTKIEVDRTQAREFYRLYKQHRDVATPMDAEIRRAYKEIAQGRMVISALASITAAGLFTEGSYAGYPKLAIARADATHCECVMRENSVELYSMTPRNPRRWGEIQRSHAAGRRFEVHMAGATWRGRTDRGATMPMIPPHLRPKQSLELYHVLWEAEWSRRVPPRDPMLLRRIAGDIWLVVAAWDLTEVERAAMAHRLSA